MAARESRASRAAQARDARDALLGMVWWKVRVIAGRGARRLRKVVRVRRRWRMVVVAVEVAISSSVVRRRKLARAATTTERRARHSGRGPARSGRPEAASLHEPGESRSSNSNSRAGDPGRERQPPAAAQPAACRDDCRQQAASEQQVEDRTRRRGATYKVADARGHGRRLKSGRQHAERPRRVWLPVDRLLSSPVQAFDRRERRRLTSSCAYAS
jgi:hypothetical protein